VYLELQAWDVTSAGSSLNEQLEIIVSKQPETKSGTAGEILSLAAVSSLYVATSYNNTYTSFFHQKCS